MSRSEADNLPADRPLACSFCGAKEAEVRKLIAGDVETICERCVVAAIDRLVHHATDPRTGRALVGTLPCSFCHRSGRKVQALVGSNRACICDRCLAKILTALAQNLRGEENSGIMIELGKV